MIAAQYGHIKVVETLLQNGASVDLQSMVSNLSYICNFVSASNVLSSNDFNCHMVHMFV